MHKIRKLKCDVFGIGTLVGGAGSAAAQVYAANQSKAASDYAADRSYEGAVATNNANIQMANDLNTTNIMNTKETNATNIELNRMTNQANRELAEKQNQWNIEQWNRQNEYNSPAHQVEMYRKAGLNPATLAGGWSDAQQLSSAPLANQVAPTIESPQATALPSLVNPEENASRIRAEGALQSSQLVAGAVKSAAEAAEGFARVRKTKAETGQIETFTPLEAKKKRQEIIALTKQNDWYNKLSDAQWREKMEQVTVLRNTASLIKSQTEKSVIEAELSKFDLGLKKKTEDILLQMPKKELLLLVEKIKSEKSSQSASYASARYSDAAAGVENWKTTHGQNLPNPKTMQEKFLMDVYSYLTENGKYNSVDALIKVIKEKFAKDEKKPSAYSFLAPWF